MDGAKDLRRLHGNFLGKIQFNVCVFVSDGFYPQKGESVCVCVCGCFSVKRKGKSEERICRYIVLRNRGLEARERKGDF